MIYVARDIGFATGILGLIFALGGAGSVAGAYVAVRLGRLVGHRAALTSGLALAAVGAACVPIATGPTLFAIALLAAQQIIGDAGYTVYHVHDRTMRQTAVPAPLLARVDGAMRTLGYSATLAGALGGGWLASVLGARAGLVTTAVLLAAGAAVSALVRERKR